jgi:hypothetical protein
MKYAVKNQNKIEENKIKKWQIVHFFCIKKILKLTTITTHVKHVAPASQNVPPVDQLKDMRLS